MLGFGNGLWIFCCDLLFVEYFEYLLGYKKFICDIDGCYFYGDCVKNGCWRLDGFVNLEYFIDNNDFVDCICDVY